MDTVTLFRQPNQSNVYLW